MTAATGHKYVYGVARVAEAERVRAIGIDGDPVHAIALDDVAALASDVPEGELEGGREELMTHTRVLGEALAAGVVLPMRFGVVMPEEAVKERLLEGHHEELLDRLAGLDGKVELNVKGIYDEAALLAEVVRDDDEIARLRESLRGQPEDATYYERIRLGELVADAVDARRRTDGRRIVERLAPLAVDVAEGEPVHERMAVNASFLVERERVEEFDVAVDAIGEEQEGRMRLKYTGPLPPHSFVELSLEE